MFKRAVGEPAARPFLRLSKKRAIQAIRTLVNSSVTAKMAVFRRFRAVSA
jgi:hypothetical protein